MICYARFTSLRGGFCLSFRILFGGGGGGGGTGSRLRLVTGCRDVRFFYTCSGTKGIG